MIDIGSSTGHKIGILLVFTTLAIGSAAGLNWQTPDSTTDYISGNQILNVSYENDISEVEFYYNEGDGWVSIDTASTEGSNGEFYWYEAFDDNNIGSVEDIELKANANESSDTISTNTLTLTRDAGGPDSFSLDSPGEFSNNEDTTVEVSVSDQYSGVENISIVVENENNDEEGSTECDSDECDLDLDNLDEGEEYSVEISAYDRVGNSNSDIFSFTVDTEYDGDSNPSFGVEDESNGIVYFNQDKDLTVDFGSADSVSDTGVECYVGGEGVDSFTVETGEGDQEYTCEIDLRSSEDYYDTSAEIYLQLEDQAGNTAESDSETVSFDVNPPVVSGLELSSSAELYNSNFDIEFSAFDSASDVEEVEYYFDSSTSYGEGSSLDYSSDTDSYEVDTSGLDADDHTLYVRAKDEAGRWSSPKTVEFSFDPGAVPEISLEIPENVLVTAGQQGNVEVVVENTGNLYVSSIELTGSAEGVFSDSQSISRLEPGESVTAVLEIDTEEANIGEHTIHISTDSPSLTERINLLVEANQDQRNQIDSDLSNYENMLQEIETNVTSLKQKVSENKKQRLESNFSVFKQKVENAQTAVDNGDYYEAEEILKGIDQDYATAESTYEAVQKEYKNNQFWMFIFLGIGGVVVLGAGAIGGLTYTDEVDFDIREYIQNLQEIEIDTSSVEKFTDKIKRSMEGKDTSDAEDFEWDGFNNK